MATKITKDQIHEAIQQSNSMASAASKLGLHVSTFTRYAKKFELYIPNQGLKGSNKPKRVGNGKISLNDILDGLHPQYQSYKLKHRLYEAGLKDNKCEKCGIDSWNKGTIQCELDHIDGNRLNHSLYNLQILCPNCHSQTETFRFKRGKSG